MTATTYTPAEFAAAFPRARAHETATSFIAVEHHPKQRPDVADLIPAGHDAIQVGYTNASRSRTVTRFAIVPVAE